MGTCYCDHEYDEHDEQDNSCTVPDCPCFHYEEDEDEDG